MTDLPVVHIVDDDPSVRAALEDLLASVGIEAQADASVAAFMARPRSGRPACLILDIRMPGQSGMDFHRNMVRQGWTLPVIFITGHGDIAMGVEAMKNGAVEFLTKPFREQDLLDAIQRALDLDCRQRTDAAGYRALQHLAARLTQGELAVARLVVQGLLNKQIADRLHVSEITVKVRRRHAMEKLGAQNLADFVRLMDRIDALPGICDGSTEPLNT